MDNIKKLKEIEKENYPEASKKGKGTPHYDLDLDDETKGFFRKLLNIWVLTTIAGVIFNVSWLRVIGLDGLEIFDYLAMFLISWATSHGIIAFLLGLKLRGSISVCLVVILFACWLPMLMRK